LAAGERYTDTQKKFQEFLYLYFLQLENQPSMKLLSSKRWKQLKVRFKTSWDCRLDEPINLKAIIFVLSEL